MKKITKRIVSTLVLLVITLSILLSSLTSCRIIINNLINPEPDTKEEISQSVEDALNSNAARKKNVYDYLDAWKVAKYDRYKFAYMELRFKTYYNLEGGLPDTLTHAADTVKLFLENYYDTIDLNDNTAVTDALLYCYVASIGDPYSVYRPPVESDEYNTEMSGQFGGIGVVVEYNDAEETIMIGNVYPDSPAEKAGVKFGDIIYAVDGKTVEELGYRNAVYYVRGEIGTNVELTLLRDGEFVTVTATRGPVEEINADYKFDPETKLGYIVISSFKGNTYEQFKNCVDALEELGAIGIVFDLRNNLGGYVQSVCDILSYVVPTGETLLSYQYKGKKETVIKSYDDAKGVDHVINVPFTVLCNGYTASAGEIFTAAMRDFRDAGLVNCKIIGTNTYGKGIMQNVYYYTDDSSVTITVAYYNPPCGVNYHGTGVLPDVIIEHSGDTDIQLLTAQRELLELIDDN